jgi:hypothetical protein
MAFTSATCLTDRDEAADTAVSAEDLESAGMFAPWCKGWWDVTAIRILRSTRSLRRIAKIESDPRPLR